MTLNIVQRLLTFFLLLLSVNQPGVLAQNVNIINNAVSGPDPLLFNGRFYSFFLIPGTIGSPFLIDAEFRQGSVTIRGETFTGVSLNYDVYNQQLVMRYHDDLGAVNQIVISDAWLEGFTLSNMQFRVMHTNDTTARIFRVLGSGPDFILEYQSKSVSLDNQLGSRNYRFSDLKINRFLQTNEGIWGFNGNKSFLALMPGEKQMLIRKYLNENRVRLRKCTDSELLELINFINKN